MTDDQPIHLTRAELKDLIKEAVAEAFDDIGVRTDKAEHVDEAREDFRFIRSFAALMRALPPRSAEPFLSRSSAALSMRYGSGLSWR